MICNDVSVFKNVKLHQIVGTRTAVVHTCCDNVAHSPVGRELLAVALLLGVGGTIGSHFFCRYYN